MATLNPYLIFNGNAYEAFEFYKSIFGGDFEMLQKFKDVPPEDAKNLADDEKEKIMHISLRVGKSILMGSDAPKVNGNADIGNNFHISIDAKDENEAREIFEKLSMSGKITMPMDKTFWGALFGMVVDKFQVPWMISYNENDSKDDTN